MAKAKTGRPKAYKTPGEMQKVIDAYFEQCDNNIFGEKPKPIPYTVEGLAVALGMSRRTLLRYETLESHKEFRPTIKKAKGKVLANLVERGLMGDSNPTATIFNLKNNYGYTDKTEQEVTSNNITTVIFDRVPGEPAKFAHSEDEIDD